MRLYGNIQKIDTEARMVFGYASTEAIDAHGETVLKSAIEDALEEYLEFANIREMHQLSAVGLTKEASVDDKGLYIGAHIVDDTAWGKVTSGVYKGFSIGGKTVARDPDNRKIITKILLNEISLVDRPSNPESRFDVWKAAGLHSGGDVDTADQLAKVVSERDDLRKALAAKDDELNKMATRVVSTVDNLVTSNADLRKRNAELTKRLATAATSAPKRKDPPAPGVDFVKLFDHIDKSTAALQLSMPQIETTLAGLETRLAAREAMADRDVAPARAWGRNDA